MKLRTDYSAFDLRRLAAGTRHANQSRRLLSLAAVLDGMDREQAARIGGMDRQTLRDWVHRFNEGGPDGLKDIRSKGHPPRLSIDQLAALATIVETKPRPRRRWRGALASHRSTEGRPRAVWPRLSRAHDRQAAETDRLLPYQRAPASPGPRRARRSVQKTYGSPRLQGIFFPAFQSAPTYPVSGPDACPRPRWSLRAYRSS